LNTASNPLIAETATETIQNVNEALGALTTLLVHEHSGLCRLLEPLLHALDHAANQQT